MATAVNEEVRFPAFGGVLGESVGEFLGTMVLILFGDGCVAGVLLLGVSPKSPVPLFANWIIIGLGWGLGVMLGVYVAGTVSGAHLNPAVTVAFAATRKFPWNKVAPYIVAQVLGAFVAALILFLVYHGAFVNYEHVNGIKRGQYAGGVGLQEAKVFFTHKQTFVGIFGAFGDQVLGTALLVGLIFAIVDVRNQPPQANIAPLIIGFLVVAIGLSFGYNAGYAINPARDFGPRLLAFFVGFGSLALPGRDNYFWVPIIGPLLGGLIGAYLYEYTIHQVLLARGVPPSGEADEHGRTVREPAEGAAAETGRTVRER